MEIKKQVYLGKRGIVAKIGEIGYHVILNAYCRIIFGSAAGLQPVQLIVGLCK